MNLVVKTVEVVQERVRWSKWLWPVRLVIWTVLFMGPDGAESRAEGFPCYGEVRAVPTKASVLTEGQGIGTGLEER